MDVKTVMAMSSPDTLRFSIIAGGKYAWSTGLEGVVIPVLDRFFGVGLAGEAGSDRDDARLSVAGTGGGGEAE
jgi:hypothetical protein